MQILDAFCGVGAWAARDPILPYRPAEILAILDACAIDRALVFSNQSYSPAAAVEVNRATVELCRPEPRFIPAFLLAPDPYSDGRKPEDYAEAMRKAGAKAAWVRPNFQQHGMNAFQTGELLDMCRQFRLPLFLPADTVAAERIDTLAAEFPGLRMVLTNLGYRADGWLYPLLRRHGDLNACLGPTYNPPLGPERFVAHFGDGRLIFGSGLPHFSPGGLVAHVMYARIPEASKQRILAGNLDRLMGEVRL